MKIFNKKQQRSLKLECLLVYANSINFGKEKRGDKIRDERMLEECIGIQVLMNVICM